MTDSARPPQIDAALGAPARGFIVWDIRATGPSRILGAARRTAGGGARIAATIEVPADAQAATSAEYAQLGYGVGAFDTLGPPWVWLTHAHGIDVYDRDARLMCAHDGVIAYTYDRTLSVDEVEAFIGYADGSMVDRGVKAQLASGQRVTLLLHLSDAAESDPTYGHHELLADTAWCHVIGRALADWAGKPYVDEIG